MKWNDAFNLAERYYGEHGNLLVPLDCVLDGYALGRWIEWQRRRYSATRKQPRQSHASQNPQPRRSSCTPLMEEQIARLDSIGMVWNLADFAWERAFSVAEAYYQEHGNLAVPSDYCVDGVNLNSWIRTQRQIQNGTLGGRKSRLTEEQVRRLDSIGMTWEPYGARWERSFAAAEAYYREHGDLDVPSHYERDGVDLSRWLWLQRRMANGMDGGTARKLTQEQIRRLSAIGMDWEPKPKTNGFSYYYALAKKIYDAYGHTDFPEGEVTVHGEILPESGEALRAWKREQEQGDFIHGTAKGGWPWERRALLLEIGIGTAKQPTAWVVKYRAAEAYYREHGNLLVPCSYVTEDGIRLGDWVSKQRRRRKGTYGTPLTNAQIEKLDAIGMSWDESKNRGKRR